MQSRKLCMTRRTGLGHTKGCTSTSLHSIEVLYSDPLKDSPVTPEELDDLQALDKIHSRRP